MHLKYRPIPCTDENELTKYFVFLRFFLHFMTTKRLGTRLLGCGQSRIAEKICAIFAVSRRKLYTKETKRVLNKNVYITQGTIQGV